MEVSVADLPFKKFEECTPAEQEARHHQMAYAIADDSAQSECIGAYSTAAVFCCNLVIAGADRTNARFCFRRETVTVSSQRGAEHEDVRVSADRRLDISDLLTFPQQVAKKWEAGTEIVHSVSPW